NERQNPSVNKAIAICKMKSSPMICRIVTYSGLVLSFTMIVVRQLETGFIRGGKFNEQTHLTHVLLVSISKVLRKSIAEPLLRISVSFDSRILPIVSWKKQGRTLPSASMTAETHGALHFFIG